jgi:hypothetical protein
MVSVVAGLSVARAEPNPDLDRARAQIDQVELDQALSSLSAALDRGGNDRDQLVEIYRLRGEVAVGMQKREVAVEAFVHLLALDPEAALSELVSPKIREIFDIAKAQVGTDGPLALAHEVSLDPAIKVVVRVERDTLALVKSAQVQYRTHAGVERKAIGEGQGTIAIGLADASARGARLHILDANRNRLRTIELGDLESVRRTGVTSAGGAGTVEGGAGDVRGGVDPGRRPLYRTWWLWASVSGAMLATGVGFTIARSGAKSDLDEILADDENHFFSEAEDAERRVNRYAALMGVGYGLAGAAAIAGAIFVLGGDDEGPALRPTATRDGVGMSFEVSF